MRIHLNIERNGLPAVRLLWPVPEHVNGKKIIVSRLLAQVDETIPLETGDFAMEDYILQVNGFECLHYQNVSDVLKDEDHVTIRPLESSELTTRYMLGRSQINNDLGVHLYDGVPFGKPCLRKPIRPTIEIPPRKRRRIEFEEEGIDQPDGQILIENADEDESQLALVNGGFIPLVGQQVAPKPKKRKLGNHIVRFIDPAPTNSDHDDDDEDDDFDPPFMLEDENEARSGMDSDESSFGGVSDTSATSSSESDSDPDTDSDSASDSSSELALKSHPKRILDSGSQKPPGAGQKATHARNKRRRDSKRLGHLVRTGQLPPNSSFKDMSAFLAKAAIQEDLPKEVTVVSISSQASISGTGSSSDSDSDTEMIIQNMSATNGTSANGHNDGTVGVENSAVDPLSSLLQEESYGVKENQASLGTMVDLKAMFKEYEEGPEQLSSKAKSTSPRAEESTVAGASHATGPSAKRARLDLNGATRHIFGSLGVRTPKNKEDGERTREKLLTLAKPKKVFAKDPALTDAIDEEVAPDSDAWRSKVTLMAVECVQEGIELSEPPFPFYQRWDPQQQLPNYQHKKRKRKASENWGNQAFEDEAEYYYENEEGEEEITELSEKKRNSSDLDDEMIASQMLHDISTEPGLNDSLEEKEFPLLPDDPSTLPDATMEDMVPGAFIAYKFLDMSEDTNWQPVISQYYTAKVMDLLERPAGTVRLLIAPRYRTAKVIQYDGEGNRIYGKFEMDAGEDGDDEDFDDGFREFNFAELRDVKLVRAAPLESSVCNAAAAIVAPVAETAAAIVGPIAETVGEVVEAIVAVAGDNADS